MTGTPSSFADAPGADVLSDVLRAVRLTGAVFVSAHFSAPFGLVSPPRFDPGLPMAHLRHISIFHMVTSGDCMIETASGATHRLAQGDLLLMPFADQHKFWKGEAAETVLMKQHVEHGPIEGIWTVRHGGGGEETRLVCGFIESSEALFAPLFRTLPEVVIESADTVGAGIAGIVRDMLGRVDAATPGTQAILGRMMELLFVEMLRRHASRLPEGSKGLLAALQDPLAGRALQLLHADPVRRWTADMLAREVGSSRTVLSERFNALLGKPPIEYLTSWRIQLAADRLRNGKDGIARVAADIGYESEPVFNRAFKRVTGMTPGKWRDGGGDSPALMPLTFKMPLVPDDPVP